MNNLGREGITPHHKIGWLVRRIGEGAARKVVAPQPGTILEWTTNLELH